MVENEEILGDLDSIAGDGDHGSGMRCGADAAADAAGFAADAGAGVHEVLVKAGEQWAERAGGTSGALWCAALRAVAGSLGTKDHYHPDEAVAATTAMRDAIVELGKAEPGDKTMIDALIPFLDTLTAETNAGEPLGTCLRRATERAEQAAKDTANLSPKKGRARPLAERSVGHPDPGAVSFALVASAVATYVQSNQVGSEEEP